MSMEDELEEQRRRAYAQRGPGVPADPSDRA
jgi:hypothetical protein